MAAAVGVIEVATILVGIPFVLVALARLNGPLREAGDAVSPRSVLLVNA